MKHIWAYSALLPSVLASSGSQFNVYDDLLAFPQYEIVWKDDAPVSEEYAHLRLTSNPQSSLPPPSPLDTDLTDSSPTFDKDLDATPSISYEHMIRDGREYLCTLPIVPPELENLPKTNKTAKEEEQELELATKRGWDLLKGMEGSCLYFLSGYWSYSFCYNQGVRQFHPLPPGPGVAVYPPVEDKRVDAYVLGKFDDSEEKSDGDSKTKMKLAGSGNSRYLTRKLEGGTKCDITGQERSIEVQFRCDSSPTDRIWSIKETTICQYRMTISTPRLCQDLAFRPPRAAKPHAISCQPIFSPRHIMDRKRLEDKENPEGNQIMPTEQEHIVEDTVEELRESNLPEDYDDAEFDDEFFGDGLGDFSTDEVFVEEFPGKKPLVGDVEIGGYRILPPGTKLEKGVAVGGGPEKVLATVARSNGFVISDRDLAKINFKPIRDLDDIREAVEKQAEGSEWHIDLVETARGAELRIFIGKFEKNKKKDGESAEDSDLDESDDGEDKVEESAENDAEGSDETYKEEL